MSVVVQLLVGCSLLVDTGGLAGVPATSTPSAPDGSLESGSGGGDGSVPEGGPDVDAGTDAAQGPFCPQAGTVLCADFDEPSASLPGQWDVANNTNATLAITTSRFRSPPRALGLASTVVASASLDKAVAGVAGAELAFDLFIETRGSNLSVAWFDAPGIGEIYLQPIDDAGAALLEHHKASGIDVYESTATPPIGTGAWHRVSFDVDLKTALALVKVDGVELGRRTLIPGWSTVTSAVIRVGVPSSRGTSLFYDNVTIKTR